MSIKDWRGHLSVNSIEILIDERLQKEPSLEIFSIKYNGVRLWVKRARRTGSNLLHKLAYMFTKNPIVIPVESKTPQEALKFESSKLQRLAELSIPVPKVIEVTDHYFILEDRGATIQHLISKGFLSNPAEVLEKIIIQLAALHNIDEFHGGSQIKNFTYTNDTIYFIDFEESFDKDIEMNELQFRDLFLFLFSLSKLNMDVDYESLIQHYIALTGKEDTIQKLHILSSKVSFLIKLLENKTVWNIIDRDTKSIYRLLQQLKNISPKTGDPE